MSKTQLLESDGNTSFPRVVDAPVAVDAKLRDAMKALRATSSARVVIAIGEPTDPSPERTDPALEAQERLRRSIAAKREMSMGNTHIWLKEAGERDRHQVIAVFSDVDTRFAQILERMLPHLPASVDVTRHYSDVDRMDEKIKGLELLYPELQPKIDPRLERLTDAMSLQQEFIAEEAVLPSKKVSDLAGHNNSNPSHTASRWKRAQRIFSVRYRGKEYFPAFQFADGGEPYPIVKDILEILRGNDSITDWDVAIWFTSPNSWLDGALPKTLLPLLERDRGLIPRLHQAAEQESLEADG